MVEGARGMQEKGQRGGLGRTGGPKKENKKRKGDKTHDNCPALNRVSVVSVVFWCARSTSISVGT